MATGPRLRADWGLHAKPSTENAKRGISDVFGTSVRLRLLILALLPLVVLMPILLGVTMWRWIDRYDELLIAKVQSDLRVAEQFFGQIEEAQAQSVSAVAQSTRFRDAMASGEAAFDQFLAAERQRLGLDFLLMSAGAQDKTLPPSTVPLVAQTGKNQPSAGLVILKAEELEGLRPGSAATARVPLVDTTAARPINRSEETRAMVILAAHRIAGDESGVLIGGRILNRDTDIIDRMNSLIYRGEETEEARTGTTTLFLDDVRISTNVRLFEGSRALGTRVSEAVWRQVLIEGETWLDRAFVVNDWYISGYVPLEDVSGQRIGMLYTGFLEAPVTIQRNQTILTLVLAFIAVIVATVPIFLRLASGVFAPLEKMSTTMARVEQGALDARIGQVKGQDEIGAVAGHLDRLLDQVQDRDAELRGYADNLNTLVEQRTRELSDANSKLEATFAQLVLKEKLATLGEVAAGVAHEINNPVAVIQGNMELVRDTLTPEQAKDLHTELALIDNQTQRISVITAKLLNFSRPGELSEGAARAFAEQAVRDALVLIAADAAKHEVKIAQQHEASPPLEIVESELQQILVNLFINAIQAMKSGGSLRISTQPQERQGKPGVCISVADTGEGISPEQLEQIFDPFFTTKRAQGTGLGLSISQALAGKAGGLLTAKSEIGVGTTFFLWCPAADNLS
ncbi:MAG: cache domain-containing protein [Pseudomonadota bacterium]